MIAVSQTQAPPPPLIEWRDGIISSTGSGGGINGGTSLINEQIEFRRLRTGSARPSPVASRLIFNGMTSAAPLSSVPLGNGSMATTTTTNVVSRNGRGGGGSGPVRLTRSRTAGARRGDISLSLASSTNVSINDSNLLIVPPFLVTPFSYPSSGSSASTMTQPTQLGDIPPPFIRNSALAADHTSSSSPPPPHEAVVLVPVQAPEEVRRSLQLLRRRTGGGN